VKQQTWSIVLYCIVLHLDSYKLYCILFSLINRHGVAECIHLQTLR